MEVEEDWQQKVRQAVQEKEQSVQREAILASSSLAVFKYLGQTCDMGPHPYLLDRNNLEGTRLKSCLRFGMLWLMDRVAEAVRGPRALAECRLCHSGAVEDAKHF